MLPSEKLEGIKGLGDNTGAIELADNLISSSESKHIDVYHHYFRELVEKKNVVVEDVCSVNQHAYIFDEGNAMYCVHTATGVFVGYS